MIFQNRMQNEVHPNEHSNTFKKYISKVEVQNQYLYY